MHIFLNVSMKTWKQSATSKIRRILVTVMKYLFPIIIILVWYFFQTVKQLTQGFSNFFPGDTNFSIKKSRDPKQKKLTCQRWRACWASQSFKVWGYFGYLIHTVQSLWFVYNSISGCVFFFVFYFFIFGVPERPATQTWSHRDPSLGPDP